MEIRVKKLNVVKIVDAEDKNFYLDRGYDVIDDKGNAIEKCVPQDFGSLRLAYVEQSNKIKELEAKIAELEKAKSAVKKSSAKTEVTK